VDENTIVYDKQHAEMFLTIHLPNPAKRNKKTDLEAVKETYRKAGMIVDKNGQIGVLSFKNGRPYVTFDLMKKPLLYSWEQVLNMGKPYPNPLTQQEDKSRLPNRNEKSPRQTSAAEQSNASVAPGNDPYKVLELLECHKSDAITFTSKKYDWEVTNVKFPCVEVMGPSQEVYMDIDIQKPGRRRSSATVLHETFNKCGHFIENKKIQNHAMVRKIRIYSGKNLWVVQRAEFRPGHGVIILIRKDL